MGHGDEQNPILLSHLVSSSSFPPMLLLLSPRSSSGLPSVELLCIDEGGGGILAASSSACIRRPSLPIVASPGSRNRGCWRSRRDLRRPPLFAVPSVGAKTRGGRGISGAARWHFACSIQVAVFCCG